MTRIKLCGLTRIEDIDCANRLLPEYVGFVFAGKSRRAVSRETAEILRQRLDPEIASVGVFMDEAPEIVAELLETGVIDLAQLHGHETEDEIRLLKERTGKSVIKAFLIGNVFSGTADVQEKAAECCADYVLLDSGTGTGKVFDWTALKALNRPWFLAGGLNPENVAAAVRELHPFAVDVSSGIETAGRKDPGKMEAFVRNVREAG